MSFFATALDSVEAKRWSYMARAVSEALDELLRTRILSPGAIPAGVLASARRFFHLALAVRETTQGSRDLNASVANYRIAADALRASSHGVASREQLEEQMRTFSEFLTSLAREGEFSDAEVETAKQLQRFLRQIAADAAAEDYQRYARGTSGSFRTTLS